MMGVPCISTLPVLVACTSAIRRGAFADRETCCHAVMQNWQTGRLEDLEEMIMWKLTSRSQQTCTRSRIVEKLQYCRYTMYCDVGTKYCVPTFLLSTFLPPFPFLFGPFLHRSFLPFVSLFLWHLEVGTYLG